MATQTPLSMAASLKVMTCGLRWTSRRSAPSIATIAPTSAAHIHTGTSNEAKRSVEAAVEASSSDRRMHEPPMEAEPQASGPDQSSCCQLEGLSRRRPRHRVRVDRIDDAVAWGYSPSPD